MTSLTKAFGRSLPRDMVEERASLLQATGQEHLLAKPTQLWKINDERAGKNGNCQAVYWVKERPITTELKRHAKPEKQWQTGTVYKGEWMANLKHGYGIQLWSNGNKYEGEWANGNREGHGVFWVKEKKKEEEKTALPKPSSAAKSSSKPPQPKLRRVYAGNWKNDLKDGSGVFFYTDGSRYEGNWEADQRSGKGTLFFTNGDQYTGEWKNNLQNGFGTLTKVNRDVYEGEWLNGLREGSGIYYYKKQEKIYDGEWVNDQPKCGVYLDAKEFFDDASEEAKYATASGQRGGGGGDDNSDATEAAAATLSLAAREGDPSLVSPRVPRNRGGMPIPRLRMADADGILAQAIEKVGIARAAIRALPHTALRDLFNEESLDALRRLFATFDSNMETGDGSGNVSLKHLPAMLAELSLPQLSAPQLAQLCTDLRKESVQKDTINFQDFVRAVHLTEEAKSLAALDHTEEE